MPNILPEDVIVFLGDAVAIPKPSDFNLILTKYLFPLLIRPTSVNAFYY
jgi:hypothetical protein